MGGSSRLLDGQAKYFRELGYDVYLISQDHFKEKIFCSREGITHLAVDIDNNINFIQDIRSLFQVFLHFRRIKPDVVNLGTPKMGLLGMLAAWLLRIPKRIYTCRGLRFETETGLRRKLLMAMEQLSAKLAHQVIYVSPSLQQAAEKYGVSVKGKGVVIGNGSSNGVNLEVFNREAVSETQRAGLIRKYDLEKKTVIGFIGRVSKHKGSYELVEAFSSLYDEDNSLCMILVGHKDCSSDLEIKIKEHPAIYYLPFQDDVPLYMSLFDIFVLPSWREGLPNVPIQAAAIGIPVVVSDATGCADAVRPGYNGKVFSCKDVEALKSVLKCYILDPGLRLHHGENGREWAKKFNSIEIWGGINKIYKS